MKKIFLLAIAAVGLCFTACSDDDDYNTGAATVYVQQPDGERIDSVRENQTLNVPVVVDGTQNGPIRVTVEVVSNQGDYVEDRDYIVTSHTVSIPAGKKSVDVEIRLVDERIINKAERVLTVKIVDVKGADVDAARASADFRIVDNDNIVYEMMSGEWTVSAMNYFTGQMFTWTSTLDTYDYDDEMYESAYKLHPWYDASGVQLDTATFATMPLRYKSVKVGGKEKVEVYFRCGTVVVSGLNFDTSADQSNTNLQDCSIAIVSLSGMGNIVASGMNIVGTVNDTYDRIEFNMPIVGQIYTKSNGDAGQMYIWSNVVMTKKK